MAKDVKTSITTPYVRSLLELATESNQADEIGRELADLKKLTTEQPAFESIMHNPGIASSQRAGMLERVLKGRVSPLLWKFIGVLNSKGRLRQLNQIADEYAQMLEEKKGIINVEVTVAQKLDDASLDQVRQRVSQALGKNALIKQQVDESIIGGIVLRVQDKQIDASVRHQLQSLRKRLLASRVK